MNWELSGEPGFHTAIAILLMSIGLRLLKLL